MVSLESFKTSLNNISGRFYCLCEFAAAMQSHGSLEKDNHAVITTLVE